MSTALPQLHPSIQAFVQAEWRGRLTAIQELAAPVLLSGADCVLEAPTAGGKTEAVLFPALSRVLSTPGAGVRILYIAPLRALLNNLELRAEKYARLVGRRAFKWHGDVSHQQKKEQIDSPPTLLLTTPESLEAILLRKSEWTRLFHDLDVVVVDEAHSFASGDRGGHLLSLLERVSAASARRPQRVAMTATIGNAHAMCDWIVGTGAVRATRVVAPRVGVPLRDWSVRFFDEGAETEATPPNERAGWRLLAMLGAECAGHKSIVFAGSRKAAESVAERMTLAASKGLIPQVRVRTHHANVSRFFREYAEDHIQVTGESGVDAILSTSTLELGIDLGPLERVIQLGSLGSSSALLQRVGRTGRRPGVPQYLRGICTDADDLLIFIGTACLAWRGVAEALPFHGRAFHLLAHQIMCLSLQNHGVDADGAWKTLRVVSSFRKVQKFEFDKLLRNMVDKEYLREVDGLLVIGPKGEERFLAANWRKLYAVFEDAPLFDVYEGKGQVGTLDVSFVTQPLVDGFVFTLGGLLWQAERVDVENRKVHAKRSRAGTPPRWSSRGGPDVPFETAQEIGTLLGADENASVEWLDDAGQSALAAERRLSLRRPWSVGEWRLVVDQGVELVTFAGDKINRTLGRLLEGRAGLRVRGDYQSVSLACPGRSLSDIEQDVHAVFGSLRALGEGGERAVLDEMIVGQHPWRFSPFAECLPSDLAALAIAERTLDVEGLLREAAVCRLVGGA